jgi:tRNA(Ile)-lysidine synthase
VSAADQAVVTDSEIDSLFADLSDAPALVLAVSGGPDSTALLWLAARWRKRRKRGPALIAVTVDHGLRPESAREAAAVKRLARALGVPHRTLRWTGAKPASGVQQAAREARYRLLAKAARAAGAQHVLTAHTRDDQAETVLFRLARGSGLGGLAGMARITRLDGMFLVRPFLDVPKARLVATLEGARVSFVEDPSNRDPRFTRPRWRELMPALAAEGLDAARLAGFARRAARANTAIEAVVDATMVQLAVAEGSSVVLDAEAFARLPAEVALRLLGRLVAQVGDEGPVELGKLEALAAALPLQPNQPAARFRRTLAGAMVTLGRGRLTVERAPARRYRRASHGIFRGRKRT